MSNQIYTAEQRKELEKAALKFNDLPPNAQAARAFYMGVLAGLQIGKRKLYRQDVKTGQYIQSSEDYTPAQKKFAEAFPNKKIDCDIPARIDIDKLIANLRRSAWMCARSNVTLASCIKLYDKIIAGGYDDKQKPQDNTAARNDFIRSDAANAQRAHFWNNQPEYEV